MTDRNAIPSLADPLVYEDEIGRLRSKYEAGGRLFELGQDGVSLAVLAMRSDELARILCRTVRRGEYRFEHAVERLADIGGKLRPLYRMRLTDTIVAGVVARVAGALIRPQLAPGCYSYQKGRSSWHAVADLAGYLRTHRQQRPEPLHRGLYIVKRDIAAYGDSIPVHDGSPLWSMLDEALIDRAGLPADHPLHGLVRALARPLIRTRDGRELRFDQGVPTGSPIQPIINNLYLGPIDRALEALPGGFYARYGDDFVFAHPDAAVAREAEAIVDAQTRRLGLTIKDDKRENVYFTQPGRPSGEWPETRPTSRIEYLGCRIDFGGAMGLKRDKLRRLLRDLRRRVRATRRLVDAPVELQTATACAVIARLLDPRDVLAHPLSSLLRHITNDRRQLKQLDYGIALIVAETFAHRRGPKAFRHVPYRALRRRHGLPSLVHLRNLGHRAEAGAPR